MLSTPFRRSAFAVSILGLAIFSFGIYDWINTPNNVFIRHTKTIPDYLPHPTGEKFFIRKHRTCEWTFQEKNYDQLDPLSSVMVMDQLLSIDLMCAQEKLPPLREVDKKLTSLAITNKDDSGNPSSVCADFISRQEERINQGFAFTEKRLEKIKNAELAWHDAHKTAKVNENSIFSQALIDANNSKYLSLKTKLSHEKSTALLQQELRNKSGAWFGEHQSGSDLYCDQLMQQLIQADTLREEATAIAKECVRSRTRWCIESTKHTYTAIWSTIKSEWHMLSGLILMLSGLAGSLLLTPIVNFWGLTGARLIYWIKNG